MTTDYLLVNFLYKITFFTMFAHAPHPTPHALRPTPRAPRPAQKTKKASKAVQICQKRDFGGATGFWTPEGVINMHIKPYQLKK